MAFTPERTPVCPLVSTSPEILTQCRCKEKAPVLGNQGLPRPFRGQRGAIPKQDALRQSASIGRVPAAQMWAPRAAMRCVLEGFVKRRLHTNRL